MCTNSEYAIYQICKKFEEPTTVDQVVASLRAGDKMVLSYSLGGVSARELVENMYQNGYLIETTKGVYRLSQKGQTCLSKISGDVRVG